MEQWEHKTLQNKGPYNKTKKYKTKGTGNIYWFKLVTKLFRLVKCGSGAKHSSKAFFQLVFSRV